MLNSIRNFTKSFWAKILLGIIIIPFVFWGMGSAFRGGSQNTLVKINKQNISTKEFIDHINTLKINHETIRENLNNSIVEQLLSDLINKYILSLESENLNIVVSDKALSDIIKKDKKFLDDNNKFSRTKYEKFLITNNFNAVMYEKILKKQQTEKILFNYISGGITPPFFLIKETYNHQNKKLAIHALHLDPFYKKKEDFNELDIKKYVDNNKDKLKEEFISFRFATINPTTLVDSEEYNELFFEKVDEIENLIINETSFEEIVKKYNLKSNIVKLINKDGDDENGISYKNVSKDLINQNFQIKFKEIKNIYLLENNNEYSLVIIDDLKKTVPNISSKKFKEKIVKNLINGDIFEHNTRLMGKITTKTFKESDFVEISNSKKIGIEKILINGINDNNFFSLQSNNQLFRLKENDFTIVDEIEKNKTFLVFVKEIENVELNKSSDKYDKYYQQAAIDLKSNIYSSYDQYIDNKYKVKINYQTLDRVKNYFK